MNIPPFVWTVGLPVPLRPSWGVNRAWAKKKPLTCGVGSWKGSAGVELDDQLLVADHGDLAAFRQAGELGGQGVQPYVQVGTGGRVGAGGGLEGEQGAAAVGDG